MNFAGSKKSKSLVATATLAIFAVTAVSFVVGSTNLTGVPDAVLDTPEIASLSEKSCIEDVEYMHGSHMTLLKEWQNAFVRDGASTYESTSGKVFDISLDGTCLSCHSNPEEFCDACHARSSVELSCWQCHGSTDVGKQNLATAKEEGASS